MPKGWRHQRLLGQTVAGCRLTIEKDCFDQVSNACVASDSRSCMCSSPADLVQRPTSTTDHGRSLDRAHATRLAGAFSGYGLRTGGIRRPKLPDKKPWTLARWVLLSNFLRGDELRGTGDHVRWTMNEKVNSILAGSRSLARMSMRQASAAESSQSQKQTLHPGEICAQSMRSHPTSLGATACGRGGTCKRGEAS